MTSEVQGDQGDDDGRGGGLTPGEVWAVHVQTLLHWMIGAPLGGTEVVSDRDARRASRFLARTSQEILMAGVTPAEVERAWARFELSTLPLQDVAELPEDSALKAALEQYVSEHPGTCHVKQTGFVLVPEPASVFEVASRTSVN